MASRDEPLLGAAVPRALDKASVWFWNFLKSELTPYQGRVSTVIRTTIAATIVMFLVMTFRLPGGFQAAIFTLLFTRENPTATVRAGVRVVIASALAIGYAVLGAATLIAEPLTHFLWVMISLFVSFYVIRILPDYATAVSFGFLVAGVIPYWDEPFVNVNDRLENMLWLGLAVFVAAAVTIIVEYVFRRFHPATDLTLGIETRLEAVEGVLRSIALNTPLELKVEKSIALFATIGTSRLRRLLTRSGYGSHFITQMNATVSLVGRLVDLTESLRVFCGSEGMVPAAEDRERCMRLADEMSNLRRDLLERKAPQIIQIPIDMPSGLPFLPAIEQTVVLIPQAFSGSKGIADFFIAAPMDEEQRQRLIVSDAFSNPEHLRFAIRGTLAALASYVTYIAIDWRGLSTSTVTCIITALTTIGSSRQKQFLRLGGAIIGGIGFGMGAQVFVLPYIDSITGFTVLFVVVTAISAWIATSSARLSYLGVQLALAFYLVHLQEFTIQTSLSIARDRVFGILLGLMWMWLIFDRLWVRSALEEMQGAFARNLQLFAELTEQITNEDRNQAVKRIRQLRDQMNAGFETVRAQSDAILFEFGASRERKLKIRNDFRNWQPTLRTLLLVQVTLAQYRVQKPLEELPVAVAQAQVAFERDCAEIAHAMADEVNGRTSRPVPDIRASAIHLEEEIRSYYESQNLPISPVPADIITLVQTVASMLASLSQEIHSTYASSQTTASGFPHAGLEPYQG